MLQSKITEIGAFVHLNPRVEAQGCCQLIATHIDSDDLITAAFQQHLGEAAGGRTGVKGASCNAKLKIIQRADQLVGATGDIVIMGCRNRSRCGYPLIRPLHHGAIDHDVTSSDHGLSLTTGSRQPAFDQLAIEALGHCMSRLGWGVLARPDVVRSILIGSIKRLLQYLVRLGQPIMMLGKRG